MQTLNLGVARSKLTIHTYIYTYKPLFYIIFWVSIEIFSSNRENGCGCAQQYCFFVALNGLRESDEISFSIPRGLKPLVFGDKCFLCGNSVINGHSPEPDPSCASSLYLNQSSAWKSCSLEVNQLLRATLTPFTL